MRTIFFLLLFINLAVAIYIQLEPDGTSEVQQIAELRPEKIKPLAPVAATPKACLEWGSFVDADLANVEAAISRHQLNDKMHRQTMGMTVFYWVHIPPLRNKQHAVRKIGELNRLGVTTHTHVQDNSKWNNAISMGFFEKIEDAQAFLAALRRKGVRSAIIGARNLEQVKFVITAPSAGVEAEVTELKGEFPGTELTKTSCEQGKRISNNLDVALPQQSK
jgi:hypothetical protein